MSKSYVSTLEFCEAMGWDLYVPQRRNGTPPVCEQLNQQEHTDNYYFAFENIIAGTYTVLYGTNAGDVQPMIETTDYTINLSQGFVTLTATGKAKLTGGKKLFAKYKYISIGLSDEYVQKAIERASQRVDTLCNTTFTDGSVPNPDYPFQELTLINQGFYNRYYYFQDLPLINISSELASDIDKEQTTLTLKTGDGVKFPLQGRITLGRENMDYTLSGDVMTVVRGSIPEEHKAGTPINTICFEISSVPEGYPIIQYPEDLGFISLEFGRDFSFNGHNNIYIYETPRTFRVRFEIPGRVKISHFWGYTSIPEDIKRLTILLTKRQLSADNIMKAMIEGRNEFNPEMFNVDEQELNSIVNAYRILRMGNT
jgi:hypothetical protein